MIWHKKLWMSWCSRPLRYLMLRIFIVHVLYKMPEALEFSLSYKLLILQNGVLSLCLIVKNPWWILQCTSVYNVIKLKEKDQRGFRLTNFPEQLIQLHAIKESWNSVITFWIGGIHIQLYLIAL